jgi:hypothetical protein
MVPIAIRVVLDEKFASFFVSVFSNEPSWRLRKEKNHTAHKTWADHLEPEWKTPVKVTREVFMGTVDGRCGKDRALTSVSILKLPKLEGTHEVVERVVHACKCSAILRRRNLHEVKRRCGTCQLCKEAQHESSADENRQCLRSRCYNGAQDDPRRSDEDQPPTAEPVCYPNEQRGTHLPDLEDRENDSCRCSASLRKAKKIGIIWKHVDAAHERAIKP